ncbi:MAG: alpha-L-rhamnosidase [Bacteroidales bacterium]|nr:alpha-L-rhamnosidase [Bacteroidales bacterium]
MRYISKGLVLFAVAALCSCAANFFFFFADEAAEVLVPTRIILSGGEVDNAGLLLEAKASQAVLGASGCARMAGEASILLDFGREIQGSIKITTGQYASGKPAAVRIRLGESVSEACCDIDGVNGAGNDHAIRDFEATLPWLGSREFGRSGFRFVRIDLLGGEVLLRSVEAIETHTDLPVLGSFMCSDDRLTSIWNTGAYTLQQCSQKDYIWDGIKRDRLVWIGDMHPEVMSTCAVFGANPAVRTSLDLVRDETPLTQWMNGISSYSIWWLLIQRDWYLYGGDSDYRLSQKDYVVGLLDRLCGLVDDEGREHLDGNRFLDWPSNGDPSAIDCGLHALMIMAMEAGEELLAFFGVDSSACAEARGRLEKAAPAVAAAFLGEDVPYDAVGRKQAVALMSLAGMMDPQEAAARLLFNGPAGFSTFYGYYMLEALAKAGMVAEAEDMVSRFWGAMLDLGATTFWEDFNIEWAENAGRIDEMPSPDKVDIHKAYGDYCYKGYRHSFCHGWASGPTPWMSRHILGIRPLEPGFKRVLVNPSLGSLEWAGGMFPTPYGYITVRVEKDGSDGLVAKVKAPRGVKVVPGEGVRIRRF